MAVLGAGDYGVINQSQLMALNEISMVQTEINENSSIDEIKLPNATPSVILGFLSCVLFGVITGLPAVILGHVALSEYKSNPSKYNIKDKRLAINGLLLGYTGIVLTAAVILKLMSAM